MEAMRSLGVLVAGTGPDETYDWVREFDTRVQDQIKQGHRTSCRSFKPWAHWRNGPTLRATTTCPCSTPPVPHARRRRRASADAVAG